MAGVRELLDRFRPAGAPGPAGAAGVPAQRQAAVTAELEPVFAALTEVVTGCDRLRLAAAQAAAKHERAALEQARVLVARARQDVAAERAAAAARIREESACDLAQMSAAAAAEADEVRRRSAQRMPWHVAQVVELVRTDLAGGESP